MTDRLSLLLYLSSLSLTSKLLLTNNAPTTTPKEYSGELHSRVINRCDYLLCNSNQFVCNLTLNWVDKKWKEIERGFVLTFFRLLYEIWYKYVRFLHIWLFYLFAFSFFLFLSRKSLISIPYYVSHYRITVFFHNECCWMNTVSIPYYGWYWPWYWHWYWHWNCWLIDKTRHKLIS